MVRPQRLCSSFSFLSAVVAAFLVVCIVGCGGSEGDPASLSGKVTFDGQPIAKGNMKLIPTGDAPGQGGVTQIVDGSYEVTKSDGALAGTHKVMITATRPATAAEIAAMAEDDDEEEEEPDEDEQAVAPSEPTTQYIPAKYGFQSTLTVDLAPNERPNVSTVTAT